MSLQISIRKDDYENIAAGVNLPNDAQTTKMGLGINYSDVDYRIDSLTGVSAYLLVQEGLELFGGDYDFSKISSGVTYGRTMQGDHWLKLALSAGIGDGLEDVHDGHEYFMVGGSSSIRGYPSGYQAGDQFVTFSAQYEIPVWRPAMWGFTGTVSVLAFLDAGSAWLKDVDDADPVAGAGVGMRAYVNELQSFALSVDVGYGFEEEDFQTYLTLGSAL